MVCVVRRDGAGVFNLSFTIVSLVMNLKIVDAYLVREE